MPQRSRSALIARRAFAWTVGWVFSAALYLLLIDRTDLPELIVGACAAALAATGVELAREQRIVGESVRVAWLARLHRPLLKIPGDIAFVALVALRALRHRDLHVGAFRAVPFACGEVEKHESGRRALAEAAGSI